MTQPPLGLSASLHVVHEETHEVQAGYWATHAELADGSRVRLMQAHDPHRKWARGSGGPRWRQRTLEGRRLHWREADGECVVCVRQDDVLLWLHAQGMTADDALALAASVETRG
ncbi:MAG TPA: hypothetical protein VNA30_02280 [Mycobacteriales bacterium]|nr:hypothetical protein [Mycobacteriales bacterium]